MIFLKYYLVGIKGTGMCALANFLKCEGHIVVGSDKKDIYFTDEILLKNDIPFYDYNINNLKDDYVYIIGLSISDNNIEFKEIISKKYTYYYYNEFIGNIHNKELICVSGTHGKTTTTSFLYQLADNNVSSIIGDGTGYSNINNQYLVVESCEYQNHFLKYCPKLGIILNMELDHPDFFNNLKDVIDSFQKFANNSEILLINGDDKNSKKIKHKHKYTYGFQKHNDYVIEILNKFENGYEINIKGKNINMNIYSKPGIHNIYNLSAAIIALYILNINIKIKEISLPNRRMNIKKYNNIYVIDDYAHHPTEIDCLLKSIKQQFIDYQIFGIFQSHTYSRTLRFKKKFKKVFLKFDKIYLRDVFSSSREEKNISLQKRIDKYFSCFQKYNIDVINNMNFNDKKVFLIFGATPSHEILNLIYQKYKNENN